MMLLLSFYEFLAFIHFEVKVNKSALGTTRTYAYNQVRERCQMRAVFDIYMRWAL